MKKVIALVLALILGITVITACGSSGSSGQTTAAGDATTAAPAAGGETAAAGNTLVRIGLNDACETLAPWGPFKITKQVVDSVIFQTLAQADKNGELQPIMAKEWENIGIATYKVTLYDYIVDTEGNEFKASDVKFCLEKFSEVNTNYVEEVTLDDDYTFTLKLTTEAPGTFEYLMTAVFMCTEAAYNAGGDEMATTPVGTTQYKLIDFVANTNITLQKVDSYWQKEELNNPLYVANVDYIEYDILTEATQLNLALEQGTVVLGRDMAYDVIPNLESKGLTTFFIDDAYCRGVMFCMLPESPFYDNLALRKAVATAINKEALVEAVTDGYGEVSKTTYGKESQNGFNTAWETDPYAYDPVQAKKYLEEAGYKEGELTITALSNENNDVKTMWTMIQADLAAIGVNLEINFASGSSYGAYRDATSGQYDIAYYGMDYGDYVTSSWTTLYDNRIRSSGLTWFGLDDPKLQKMFEELTTQAGYNQENIDAFYKYTSENLFFYQLFYQPSACVYDGNKISNIEGATNSRGYTFANALVLADGWDTFYGK